MARINKTYVSPNGRAQSRFAPLLAALSIALFAACTPPPTAGPPEPTADIPATLSPETQVPPTIEQQAVPTPEPTTPPGVGVWVDPLLPADVYEPLRAQIAAISQTATTESGEPVVLSNSPDAPLRLASAAANEPGVTVLTRTYALAAPFPTVVDGVVFDDFKRFWAGDATALASIVVSNTAPVLYLDPDTRAALALLLGQPGAGATVQMVQAQEILSRTWEGRGATLAVVPFDTLDVRYKLLTIDGVNLFEREADMGRYPLSLRVKLRGDNPARERVVAALPPRDNRDLERMAIVAMTGVTAMVRGTAVRMEEKGVTYPGEAIRDWLRTADVAHISNEVSFWDKCRPPTRNDGVVMCSNPKYMDLLRDIGTDIVEITGNHTWDYGADKLIPTIELYEKEGWKVFGGGRNLDESRKPAIMTVRGNKLAFIGCSSFGTNWASNGRAGAAPCGVQNPQALDWIEAEIRRLKAEGYLVIATLQYTEFYSYVATRQQDFDFRRLRDAGAVVVNGSQGHHVQGFDVSEAGFAHYGTGNLFFGDQVFSEGAQQTMVDRHVFYNGRYLGVDLRTAKIEDISKPVPMTPEARAALLATLFKVSGY
jgi:poly-gamma-glutamate synthesis protein (capsule biosynthesis protein)